MLAKERHTSERRHGCVGVLGPPLRKVVCDHDPNHDPTTTRSALYPLYRDIPRYTRLFFRLLAQKTKMGTPVSYDHLKELFQGGPAHDQGTSENSKHYILMTPASSARVRGQDVDRVYE
jgi:hypothetical protein